MLFEKGDHLEGCILFKPTCLVSIAYWQNTDFKRIDSFNDNVFFEQTPRGARIIINDKSLPHLSKEELFRPLGAKDSFPSTIDKKYGLLFNEQGYFHKKQIRVSYYHNEMWRDFIPQKNLDRLVRTRTILQQKKPLDIFFFGDSISAGYNCSRMLDLPPYQAPYPELLKNSLIEHYSYSDIRVLNLSVPGKNAEYGKHEIEKIVKNQSFGFDLVVLAWGANDSSGKRKPKIFCKNIQEQIEKIRKFHPSAEFIIISSSLKNNLWNGSNNEYLFQYKRMLENKLLKMGNFIEIADLTTLWQDLLKYKNFYDVTGNGLNHPNDFGHLVYSQALFQMIAE